MNMRPFVSAIAGVSLLLGACGDDGSTGGSGGAGGAAGSGGSAGATGSGGTTSSTHTCADLAACCTSTMFSTAAAKPGSNLSPSQCSSVSGGGNEPACRALYNGYQLLSACP